MKNKSAFVLGGYGNFGKMISKALVEKQIPVIIAGRSATKMAEYV